MSFSLLDYICSLSHIGYVHMLPVLLAYINRLLLYISILSFNIQPFSQHGIRAQVLNHLKFIFFFRILISFFSAPLVFF